MSNEVHTENWPKEKPDLYRLLSQQLAALMEGETHPLPNLANASALLWQAMEQINWVGFYLNTGHEELLLGPFQGKTACVNIERGKGVCGTAFDKDETQLVEDVHKFPGHIACDSASNSEIVVPIHKDKEVVAVLDIDSPLFSRFNEKDKEGLESFVKVLEGLIDWD